MREIVGLVEVQYLPANEIIIYAGEIPKEFYIVECGFCTVSTISFTQNKP